MASQEAARLGLEAEEADLIAQAEAVGQRFQAGAVGAIAN